MNFMKCVARAVLQVHDVAADEPRAVIGDRLDGAFELGARRREAGDDRLHQHAGVDAGVDQLAHRAQPLQRVRRARARAAATRLRRPSARSCRRCTARRRASSREHVAVAHDHRALGDEPDRRCARAGSASIGAARQLVVPFDRLVADRWRCRRRRTRAVHDGRSSSRASTSTKFCFTRMTDANSSSASISNWA